MINNTMACDQLYHIAPLVSCFLCGDTVHVVSTVTFLRGFTRVDTWFMVEIEPYVEKQSAIDRLVFLDSKLLANVIKVSKSWPQVQENYVYKSSNMFTLEYQVTPKTATSNTYFFELIYM